MSWGYDYINDQLLSYEIVYHPIPEPEGRYERCIPFGIAITFMYFLFVIRYSSVEVSPSAESHKLEGLYDDTMYAVAVSRMKFF